MFPRFELGQAVGRETEDGVNRCNEESQTRSQTLLVGVLFEERTTTT